MNKNECKEKKRTLVYHGICSIFSGFVLRMTADPEFLPAVYNHI